MHPEIPMASFALRVLALLLGLGSTAALAQQPPLTSEGQLVDLPKVAADAALPAWLTTGLRLSYYAGSSTQPSVRQALANLGNGNYLAYDQSGVAGGGYLQYDFVHVSDEALAVRGSNLVYADATLQNVTLAAHHGHLGDKNGILDIWIHPQRLAGVPEQKGEGWLVRRAPYEVDGQRTEALITHYEHGNGYARYVYELATGLLLVHSSATTGKPVLTPGANGAPTLGPGAVTVTSVIRKGVRKLGLPWLGRAESVPSWMKRGQRFLFTGGEMNSLAEGLLPPNPAQIEFAIEKLGRGFAYADTRSVVDYGGNPSRGSAKMVYGAGTVGSLFVDPKALAKLRAGQVLDQDPLTRYQIRCVGRDERTIALEEAGPLDGTTLVFDLERGQLQQLVLRRQQGPASITTQLQLNGVR
jgi:hypothetical protein